MDSVPSPEVVRSIQMFLLQNGRRHKVSVKITVNKEFDPLFSVKTYEMKFTENQINNIKELMMGFQLETNKDE